MRSLEFLSPDYLHDPWPIYEQFRREQPIWWCQEIGMFCVFRHDHVRSILKDPRFSVEFPFRVSEQVFGRTLLDMDGPEHVRLRKRLAPILHANNLSGFAESVVAPLAESLVARLPADAPFDFMATVAERIPVLSICEFLGLPTSDAAWVFAQMMVLMNHLDDSKGKASEVSGARGELRAWLKVHLARLRAELPVAVGFRRLHEEALDEKPEALEGLYIVLLAAGIETSVCLLGNAMALLSERPEWFARLAQDPGMARLILEEVLRLEPVQQDTVRFALENLEIAGVRIRRGQALKLLLASAGRDEAVYASPNEFDPLRSPAGGLPFSAGLHACPGQRFALLEAEMTLRALWNRFGAIARAPGMECSIRGAAFRRPSALYLKPAMAPALVAKAW